MPSAYKEMCAKLLTARKEKLLMERSVLTCIKGDCDMKAKTLMISDVSDKDVYAIVNSYIKKNAELIHDISSATNVNAEALKKAEEEKAFLKTLLPQSLTPEEIESILQAAFSEGKDLGAMMNVLKDNYFGKYDGRTASETAKRIIAKAK